jgi:hypothetical protein
MMPISLTRFRLAAAAAALVWTMVACDDTGGLGEAAFPNVVDTATIYALQLTPLTTPSAFDIANGHTARTDKGEIFDFALDFDESNTPLMMPAGALNLPPEAGLIMSDRSFEEVTRPPDDDFVLDSALTVATGDVFIGRSRPSSSLCGYFGALPRYGKFHVLEIDVTERKVTLEFLVNLNCGFRSLEPGFPTF